MRVLKRDKIKAVVEAAIIWAYCPNSGSYECALDGEEDGVEPWFDTSIEGTCENLNAKVRDLTGEGNDEATLRELAVFIRKATGIRRAKR